MSDFNLWLLLPAALAVLLFASLAIGLAKRTQGRGLEPPDPRPGVPTQSQPQLQPARPSMAAPPLIVPTPASIAPAPAPAATPVIVPAPATPYTAWRLLARNLANPDSAGGPLYRLRFMPEEELPEWHAGAIAKVYCGSPDDVLAAGSEDLRLAADYMIASLPSDEALELVVRVTSVKGQGSGDRSRWLCHALQTGQQVAIAIRDDPAFLPPPDTVPLILIGNATGIAGLRAHIKARPLGTRNWLIFGDRNSADDQVLATEITDWMSTGHLERCDLVLPGEGEEQRHVTDQIEDAKNPLLDWTFAGGAIYVCGSRMMGEDVHDTLSALLSVEVLDAMADAGLYRRAIY